jgi:hypothetical protein
MNDDRASWADTALCHFRGATGADREDAVGDMLCNLMHWCDLNNFDFELALYRAGGHYIAENYVRRSGTQAMTSCGTGGIHGILGNVESVT